MCDKLRLSLRRLLGLSMAGSKRRVRQLPDVKPTWLSSPGTAYLGLKLPVTKVASGFHDGNRLQPMAAAADPQRGWGRPWVQVREGNSGGIEEMSVALSPVLAKPNGAPT
jgi:hypothetical protein